MNEAVKEIHDVLVAQMDSLSDSISNSTEPAAVKQLLLEEKEVLHRVDVSQNLLFRENSNELEALLPKIREADDELRHSFHSVQNTAKIVEQTSKLLEYVDKALDFAKTLAVI